MFYARSAQSAMVIAWPALLTLLAQAQPSQPQYYMWPATNICESNPTGWTHDSAYQTAVRVQVGNNPKFNYNIFEDPIEAARLVTIAIRNRSFPSSGTATIDEEVATVMIVGFASCEAGRQTCLHRDTDVVPLALTWNQSTEALLTIAAITS